MTELVLYNLLLIVGIVLLISGLAATALGTLTLLHLFRPKRRPADTSNRINHIRLWWFALTRPELFVNQFPWLKNDELENISR